MVSIYNFPTDIANEALQHCRMARVFSINPPDISANAQETAFIYDKCRSAEIQRNLWKFSTRRVILRSVGIDTVIWTPPVWAAGNYLAGAVVSYTPAVGLYAGVTSYWQLSQAEPASAVTPDLDPLWHHYCGPLAIDLYNTGAQGTGSTVAINDAQIYQSGEVVLVPVTYSSLSTYAINQVVNYNGAWYVSLVNANIANTPSTSPAAWVIWTSNGRGQGSYGLTTTNSPIPLTYPGAYSVYMSLYNNNADNPVSATGNWLLLNGAILPLRVSWPIGAGPNDNADTLNCFHLPSGFLKRAPTDPKGGQMGYLGANSGSNPEDWVFEGPFMISSDYGPLMMRFVADLTDVSEFDPMFCRGLALSVARAVASILVKDKDVLQLVKADIASEYKTIMGEARATNSIEIGPITSVENRYVTVRI